MHIVTHCLYRRLGLIFNAVDQAEVTYFRIGLTDSAHMHYTQPESLSIVEIIGQ